MLELIKVIGSNKHQKRVGLYKCVCGNQIEVIISDVKRGHTKSCGCLKNQLVGNASRIHGMKYTSEYDIWNSMKTRCFNKNDKGYKNYGERGIIVCNRWRNSFKNFLEDMGKRPSNKYSIERINNNGNYEPENCKWMLRKLQSKNQRSNINITYNNKTQILSDWSREFKINLHTLYNRLYTMKWTIEKALETPVKKHKNGK